MTKIIVFHSSYGCDTGCCGHAIEASDGRYKFTFDHTHYGEDPLDFAKQLVLETWGEEHVKDLDWENCEVVTDSRYCN